MGRDPADQIKNEPAAFGNGGGVIINDTATYYGPFYALKAMGADVLIASGTVPAKWTAEGYKKLDGLTISDGDTLIIPGITRLTLTSGIAIAYTANPFGQ